LPESDDRIELSLAIGIRNGKPDKIPGGGIEYRENASEHQRQREHRLVTLHLMIETKEITTGARSGTGSGHSRNGRRGSARLVTSYTRSYNRYWCHALETLLMR